MKQRFINLALLLGIFIFISCGNQKKSTEVSGLQGDVTENTVGLSDVQGSVAVATSDTIIEQKAIDLIKDFYKVCLAEHPSKPLDSVNIKLTKGLVEKLNKVRTATDCDPIIRAQDTSDDVLETLTVKHLSGNWYMVSYTWGKGGEFESTQNIPVRVARIDGQYMIDYITPVYYDSLYGDSLVCDNPVIPTINASEPLSFVKTFYDAYTLKYSSIPEGLAGQLAALRKEYLTDNALKQFEVAEKEAMIDGERGYDLLICDFDFENLWRPSIKVVPLNKDTYEVSYMKNKTIKLKVIKQGQSYRIDSITKG